MKSHVPNLEVNIAKIAAHSAPKILPGKSNNSPQEKSVKNPRIGTD